MVRKGTSANVSQIEVEVERPRDRGNKRNKTRSTDTGSTSITGSGGTETLITNNSTGDWYVDFVTVHALGASPGVVAAEIQVRDSDDNVVTGGITDAVADGHIDLDGVILRPGWDLHMVYTQSDAGTYTVSAIPVIRKPEPSETPSGGGATTPSSPDKTVDDFEDGDISEYSGDTGNYSVQTADVHGGNQALESTSTGTPFFNIRSTSGLDNYPEAGDSFHWWVNSDTGDGGTQARIAGKFGLQDASNYYDVQFDFNNGNIAINERVSGSETQLGIAAGFTTTAGTWYKVGVDWGDNGTITAIAYESDGSTQMDSVTASTNTYASGGIGWVNRSDNGNVVRADDFVIE